jgi:hypothetical protein
MSALRVNSGTAGSRRRAFQIVNSLGTRAGLWLFSLRSRGGSHEEVGLSGAFFEVRLGAEFLGFVGCRDILVRLLDVLLIGTATAR